MSQAVLRNVARATTLPLHRPRLLPLLAFVAVLMGVSLFFVWSRLQVVNLEYGISGLEERLRSAQHETRRLRLEAASLRNPQRIELVAREELGLRLPAPVQVITVE
jgi:cell division protein FtsL